MNSRISFLFATIFLAGISLPGCGALKSGFNLFTVQDDIALGKQVKAQIESDPEQFPILPEQGNEEVYRYIRNITGKLLQTGKVEHKDEFAWEVKIIKDDETLNAFAVPGGYLYVYTGLIKFLDSEEQLAGVMGHEIAHAARRHSTQQMTKLYGLDAIRQIITGKSDPGLIEQIALGLASLRFSREHESEADEYSVIYLCPTDYKADGAAAFFKKIKGKGGTPPEFLSTHPDPGNRVVAIEKKATELACKGNKTYQSEYQRIKQLLD